MRRIVCVVVALCVAMIFVTSAMAAVPEQDITPQYTYISKLSAGLTISDATGISNCVGSCFAPSADSVKLTCKLQRYTGSAWTTVKTWSATAAHSTAITEQYAVYSGYTYRVRITCSVYNASGVLVESGTCYSHQVEY